jgi:hypothetical protein
MSNLTAEPMTVGNLRALLADVPDCAWICLPEGPVTSITKELGASEPFVLLQYTKRCPHGFTGDCPACAFVEQEIRR